MVRPTQEHGPYAGSNKTSAQDDPMTHPYLVASENLDKGNESLVGT